MLDQQLLRQGLCDVAAIAKEFAKETAHEPRDGAAIIDIARRQTEREQLATVIDHQMQLEPVEPADRGLATPRIDAKDTVLWDARVLADTQARRVNKADPGATAQLGMQIDGERQQDARHEFDKTIVADQMGKLGAQLRLDVLGVEAFEGAVPGLLEEDQDRHDLTGVEARSASALATTCHLLLLPRWFELLPEGVYRTVQVEYTHAQCLPDQD